jgi:PAS domain S-box-containing protein
MNDNSKTKQQLIKELAAMRQRVTELEESENIRKQTDEALRESEERYRFVVQNLKEVVFRTDAEGHWIFLNPAWDEVTSFAVKESLGKVFLEYVYPDDRELNIELFRPLIEKKKAYYRHEIRYITEDGGFRWIEVWARLTLDKKGNATGTAGTLTDVTERKRAEEAIREGEEKFRGLVEGLSETLYHMSLPDGKYKYVSPAAKLVLGYSAEEIIENPNTIKEAIHPDFHGYFKEKWENLIKGEVPPTYEYKIIDPEGKERWIIQSNRGIFDDQGKIIAIEGICRDITERKRTEDALRESEEKYRLIAEHMADVISVLDMNLHATYVSPSIMRLRGLTVEEAMKEMLDQVLTTESLKIALAAFEEERKMEASGTADPNRTRILELEEYRKDGSTIWVESSLSYLRDEDNKPVGMLATTRDITERKRAEEEKRSMEERLQRAEKMEALGTMAGGVAHDLNNVLGIVVGYAELLLNSVDEHSSIRPHFVHIMKAGERAAAIVQDLLTLARRGVPGQKVLNLNRIISDFNQLPESKNLCFYHSSVQIKTDLEPDLLNISGSSVHLTKTLFNLVSNASEAMQNGGIVTIKTANQYLDKPIQGYDEVREGDYVVLSVSDMGEGISAADMKRIFEPFYTKKVMGRSGTGLGLAVVWGTVKDHHGYINVQSEEGKGSTFTLYFPVSREDISAERIAVAISEYMGKGESILIVDDVKEQRDLAAEMLRKLNYTVTRVSSGEEAVACLKEHQADLVVLDMIMDPGMDGLDTYKKILEIHSKQKAIIVSGFSETYRVTAAQALGAGAYVRKPYVIEKLGLAVRKEVDRK